MNSPGHSHSQMKRHQKLAKKALVNKRDQSTNCLSGALYTAPKGGERINSNLDTHVTWDTRCLETTDKIDIYLYAPTYVNSSLPIHKWSEIPANRGWVDVKLAPRWWASDPHQNSTVDMNLNIVKSGNEPWDSANPIGPTWTAVYTVPADGKIPEDAFRGKVEKLISPFYEGGHLTAAGKTAAIVCPIVIVAVALGVFIRKLHINRNNKTADWADVMDKRMSRISVDWTSGGDGSSGVVPGVIGTRPGSYYSRASHETSNMAGRGAGNRVPRHMEDITPEFASEAEMREARPRGASMYSEGNRTSRISFAGNTAGDRVSRISFANSVENNGGRGIGANPRAHKSSASLPRVGQNGFRRSAHQTDSYYDADAPAVPRINTDKYRSSSDDRRQSRFSDGLVYADEDEIEERVRGEGEDDDEILMSPTQNDGPTPLGVGDVDRMKASLDVGRSLAVASPDKAKAGSEDDVEASLRNSMLSYPALSMMQSGRRESDGHDMFAALTSSRPVSGVTDDSRLRDSYIDHKHYNTTNPAIATVVPSSSQTGMAPPSNATSPDEAMKQYAALRAGGATPSASSSNPGLGPGNNTMRTLYTPDSESQGGHKAHQSVAGSSLNEDEVVGYNEMIDHGGFR
ncbi:hypothetical protein IE53DRAFT_367058 [Violaceomyces palustris]|uniref:Uncharacterized protein n=1 Tax=Violaceomyces palustris TaxID=1673888 RepID=A0ACD0P3F0_9BASI|nr:hypothetical protein IE53DRAFT_367058 [Violaceomyces palustris]